MNQRAWVSLAWVAAGTLWGVGGEAEVRAPAGVLASAPASGPAKPAVVVLPFATDFPHAGDTDEDYGQLLAFAIAGKWRTISGWEVIDRFTAADAMAAGGVGRGCAVDRSVLAAMVRGRLAADVVVFGAVSGAGKAKTIRACVIDYRGAPRGGAGKAALDKTYKMAYWTDLRFILEDAVAAVTGHVFTHPSEDLAILDPASLAAWKKNPNLVPNPTFARGAAGRLEAWEGVIESHRYRPPWSDSAEAPIQEDRTKMILWTPAPSGVAGPAPSGVEGPAPSGVEGPAPDSPGEKVLQFAMPTSVAAAHGLACYSEWIPVQAGHRYRCAITYASKGPTFFPFVKGYALIDTPGEAAPQRREVYRRQFPKLKSTGGRWETTVADFVPSVLPPKHGHRAPYRLEWVRVDLYCYWPAGRVWVKDVAVRLVETPGPDGKVSDPAAPVPAKGPPGGAGGPASRPEGERK